MRLVFGIDDTVAAWTKLHIPAMADSAGFGFCTAIGVENQCGEPIAGIVFSSYRPEYRSIEISVASESSRWLTKRLASMIMAYPFAQLGCERVSATTPSETGTSVSRFLTKFGFVREGVLRRGLGTEDAVVWSMLADEWARSRFNVARLDVQVIADTPRRSRSRRSRSRAKRKQYQYGDRAAEAQPDQHHRA